MKITIKEVVMSMSGNEDTTRKAKEILADKRLMEAEKELGFGELKEEDLDGKSFEEIREVLEQELPVLEKLGLDVTFVRDMLKKIDAPEDGEVDGDILEQFLAAGYEIKKIKKMEAKYLARKILQTSHKEFGRMRGLGADLKKPNEIFKKISQKVRTRDFICVLELFPLLESSLEEAKGHFYSRNAGKILDVLSSSLEMGRTLDLDLTEVENKMGKAGKLLSEGKYESSWEMAGEAKKLYRTLLQNHFRERSQELLDEMDELVEKSLAIDLEVDVPRKKKRDCELLFRKEKYQDCYGLVQKFLPEFIEIVKGGFQKEVAKLYPECMEQLKIARSLGLDVEWEMEQMDGIEGLKEQGDYESPWQILGGCKVELNNKIREEKIRLLSGKLDELKVELDSFLERTGKDAQDLDVLYLAARNALDEKDVESVPTYLDKLSKALTQELHLYTVDEYAHVIDSREFELDGMKEIGVKTDSADELLTAIRERITFLTMKEGISEREISGIKERIGWLEEMLLKLNTEQCKPLAKKYTRESRDLMDQVIELGVDVSLQEQEFDTVLQLMGDERFVDAMKLCKIVNSGTLNTKKIHFKNSCEEKFLDLDEQISRAKALNIDIEDVGMSRKTALSLFKEEKYQDVLALLQKSSSVIGDSIEKVLHSLLVEKEGILTIKIGTARELEVDVQYVHDLLANVALLKEGLAFEEGVMMVEKAIQQLSGEIDARLAKQRSDSLEKHLAEMKELCLLTGEEYPDLAAILEEAKNATSEKNYDGADDKFHRFQEGLKFHQKEFELGKRVIEVEKIGPVLERIQEFGLVDSSEISDTISSALLMVSQKDLSGVDEVMPRIHELLGGAFNQILDVKLNDLEKKMEYARELDVDTQFVSDALSGTTELVKKRSFENAIALVKETDAKLDEAIDGRLGEMKFQKLEELEGVYDEFTKRSGKYPDALAGCLTKAKDYIQKGNYSKAEECFEYFGEKLQLFEDEYELEQCQLLHRKREQEVIHLKNLELDVSELESALFDSLSYISRRSIKKAREVDDGIAQLLNVARSITAKKALEGRLETCGELLAMLRSGDVDVGEMEVILQEILDMQAEKEYVMGCGRCAELVEELEKMKVQYLKEKAQQAIDDARATLDEFGELGLETTEMDELVARSVDALDQGDLEGSAQIGTQAQMFGRTKIMTFHRKDCEERIDQAAILLESGREYEIDGTSYKETLLQASEELQKANFSVCRELVERSESDFEKERQRKITQRYEQAQETFNKRLIRAEELEVDTSKPVSQMKNAISIFDENMTQEGLSGAIASIGVLEDTIHKKLLELLAQRQKVLWATIKRAEEIGIETLVSRDTLFGTDDLAEKGLLDRAIADVNDVDRDLMEKIDDHNKTVRLKILTDLGNGVLELSDRTGEEYPDLEECLEKARTKVQEKRFAEADVLFGKFKQKKSTHERNYNLQLIGESLGLRKERLERLESVGIDVSDMEVAIGAGLECVNESDLEGALGSLGMVDELIEYARSVTSREMLKERRLIVKDMLLDLAKEGLKLKAEKKRYNQITGAGRKKKYLIGLKIVDELKLHLVERKTLFHRKRSEKMLGKAVSIFKKISNLEVGEGAIGEKIARAKELIAQTDYEQAEVVAGEAFDQGYALELEFQRARSVELLDRMDGRFREGIELGMSLDQIKNILLGAHALFDEGEYEQAWKVTTGAETIYEEKRKIFLNNLAHSSYDEAQALLMKAEELGIDYASEETLLNYAEADLEESEFESGLEFINSAVGNLKNMVRVEKENRLCRKFLEESGELEAELAELERIGLDVADTRVFLVSAIENASEFKAEKLVEFKELLESSLDELVSVKARKLAEEKQPFFSELYGEVLAQGADVSGEGRLLKEAQDSICSENYVEALAILWEINSSLLEKQKPYMEKVFEIMVESRSLLSELKEKGIENDDIIALFQQVQDNYNNDRYSASMAEALKVKEMCNAERNRHFGGKTREKLETLQTGLDTGLKVNRQSIEVLMEKAREQMKKKLFEDSFASVESACEILDESIREELEQKFNTRMERTTRLLNSARAHGLKTQKPLKALKHVMALHEDGELEKALERVEKVYGAVVSPMNERCSEEFVQGKRELSSILESAEKLAVNISHLEQSLDDIGEMNEQGKYYEGNELVTSVLGEVQDLIHAQRVKSVGLHLEENLNIVERLHEALGNIGKRAGGGGDADEGGGDTDEGGDDTDEGSIKIGKLLSKLKQARAVLERDEIGEAEEMAREIQDDINDHKDILLENIYPSIFAGMRERSSAMEDVGVTVPALGQLLVKAEEHIDSADMESLPELLSRLMGIMEKAEKEVKLSANERIKKLTQISQEMLSHGVPQKDLKEIFHKVRSSFKSQDYLMALVHMSEAETALLERTNKFYVSEVERLGGETDELVAELGKMDASDDIISVLQEREGVMKGLLDEGKLLEAHMVSGELETKVNKARTWLLKQKATEALEATLALVSQIKCLVDEDSFAKSEVLETITRARSYIDEELYEKALKIIEEAQLVLNMLKLDHLRRKAMQVIKDTGVIMEAMKSGSTERYDSNQARLEKALGLFENVKYEEAMELLDRIKINFIETEKECLEEFIDSIASWSRILEHHGEGLNVELDKLTSYLDADDFDVGEIVDHVKNIHIQINELTVLMEKERRFLDLHEQFNLILSRFTGQNMEPSGEFQEQFRLARGRRDRGDLEKAISILEGVNEVLGSQYQENMLSRAREEFIRVEKGAMDVVEKWNGLGLEAEGELQDTLKLIDELLGQAKEMLKAGNHEECMGMALKIQNLAHAVSTWTARTIAGQELSSAGEEMEKNRKMVVQDINCENTYIMAQNYFEKGDYDNAVSHARKALEYAMAERMRTKEKMIRSVMEDTELRLRAGEEMGINMKELVRDQEKVVALLKACDHDASYELAVKVNKRVEGIFQEHGTAQLEKNIKVVQDLFQKALEEELSVDGEEKMLVEAQELADGGKLEEARVLVEELEGRLEERIKTSRMTDVKTILDRAWEILDDFEMETGMEFESLSVILEEAKARGPHDDVQYFQERVARFYVLKDELERDIYTRKYKKELEHLERQLLTHQGVGLDISDGLAMLPKIQEEIDEGKFQMAKNIISDLDKYISEDLTRAAKEAVHELMNNLAAKLELLKEHSVDTQRLETSFSNILSLIDEGKYLRAYVLAKSVSKEIYTMWDEIRDRSLLNRLKTVEGFYSKLRSNQYFSQEERREFRNTIKELQKLYSEASWDHLDGKLDIIENTISTIEGRVKDKGIVSELLIIAEKLLSEGHELHANMDGEQELLNNARDLVGMDKFKKAGSRLKNIVERLENKLAVQRKKVAYEMLEDAEKRLQDASGLLSIERKRKAQILNKMARDQLEFEKYDISIKNSRALMRVVARAEKEAGSLNNSAGVSPSDMPTGRDEEKIMKVRVKCPMCVQSFVTQTVNFPAAVKCPSCQKKLLIKGV